MVRSPDAPTSVLPTPKYLSSPNSARYHPGSILNTGAHRVGLLESIQEMKAKAQADVDKFSQLEELAKAPTEGDGEGDLKGQLDKVKEAFDAKAKECDALRGAIQAEIDDKKTDTKRLEKAIEPIEEAPAPEMPADQGAGQSPVTGDLPKPDHTGAQDDTKSPDGTQVLPGDAVPAGDIPNLPGA